jgi:hypothetical protein
MFIPESWAARIKEPRASHGQSPAQVLMGRLDGRTIYL